MTDLNTDTEHPERENEPVLAGTESVAVDNGEASGSAGNVQEAVNGNGSSDAPGTGDENVLALHRAKKLRGTVTFTGDAHQAVLACALAALCPEPTRLGNLPTAPDGELAAWFTEYRVALEALGVVFEPAEDGHMLVRGPREGLVAPSAPLVVHHELAALALAGLCSGRGLSATLRVDAVRVPGDTVALLRALWPQPQPQPGTEALEAAADAAYADIVIGTLNPKARGLVKPYERLAKKTGEETAVKIALLFHHLAAGESLELHLRRQGPDLLETMLLHFEVDLKVERDDDKEADELTRRIARQMRAAGKEIPVTRLKLAAGARPSPAFLVLAGDVTEASAVALAATLIKGSDVLLEGVLLNTGRAAFFAALRRLGGDVEVVQRREPRHGGGETQGTVRVRTSDLVARRFDAEVLADLRDEVFLLLAAAAYAEGESVFRDLDGLRLGPLDRLREFTAALKRGGVETGEIEDGVVIRGRSESDGAAFDALGHPGLAAACVAMALKSHGASTLAGADALAARHPGLLDRLQALQTPATATTEKTA